MTSLVLLKIFGVKCLTRVGCLTVHLPHEITLNANLMQLGNFIDVLLGRHVSGIRPSSGTLDVVLQHMVFCTEFLDGWWS
jgi:hypothetical protein